MKLKWCHPVETLVLDPHGVTKTLSLIYELAVSLESLQRYPVGTGEAGLCL